MPVSTEAPVARRLHADAEAWRETVLRERGPAQEPEQGWKWWKREPLPRRPGTCNNCGRDGHWARECTTEEGEPEDRETKKKSLPRRGLMPMPCCGRYTTPCEHTEQALALRREAIERGEDPDEGLGTWPTPQTKPRGWEFYELLGRPRTIVAPMVDQSELSYRLLCKRYGADLCYSPMINSSCFMKDPSGLFRNREFSSCPGDTNMFAQLCGNDPETVVGAALDIEQSGAKAIDLNLGCPQGIAKKGFYGAFLMDHLPLIRSIVTALDSRVSIPITCKMRIFPDVQHTIAYAQMLEEAGASIVTVHGRRREQKGMDQGPADWEFIRRVKESLKVPVFANGNIWHHGDIDRCLAATGCDGMMVADGLLWDARLFSKPQRLIPSGRHFFVEDPVTRAEGVRLCLEYLDICATHPTQVSHMKSHVFKMTHNTLQAHPEMRKKLSDATAAQESKSMRPIFYNFCQELLALETAAIQALPPLPVPGTSFEERLAQHLAGIASLGNVTVPPECELSRITRPLVELAPEDTQGGSEGPEEELPALFD